MGLTYPAVAEVHQAPETSSVLTNVEEREGTPPRARGNTIQTHPARSTLIPKDKLSGHIWLHDRDRSSPAKQKGWAEWAYQMRHRAREDTRIIVDPPMAKAEIRLLKDLLLPVRKGLTFPEGIPEAHKDMFFGQWMASSFFLEMVARWTAPHRREDLWRALSVVQYAAHRSPKVQHSSSLIWFPLIQVLWYEVSKQGLYFVRLHPGLTLEAHKFEGGTAEAGHSTQGLKRN